MPWFRSQAVNTAPNSKESHPTVPLSVALVHDEFNCFSSCSSPGLFHLVSGRGKERSRLQLSSKIGLCALQPLKIHSIRQMGPKRSCTS
ncbi:hypothetical protein MRB53_020484 [Persea americana]|uniref:Uncharacterized protein n=1 Tax=Persea americana TaxID=3435 RepID=A0ACC2L108_PERAE|nr:hypothetical protein MRB53_020484 [Persea americana]